MLFLLFQIFSFISAIMFISFLYDNKYSPILEFKQLKHIAFIVDPEFGLIIEETCLCVFSRKNFETNLVT